MTQINVPKDKVQERAAFNLSNKDWFMYKWKLHYTVRREYHFVDAMCLEDNEIVRIDGDEVVKPVDVTIDVKYRY